MIFLFDISVCMTLERQESEILAVNGSHELAVDCFRSSTLYGHRCIEYRDNATSMPRWLLEYGQIY